MKELYENAVLKGYWFNGIDEDSEPNSLNDCENSYARVFENINGYNIVDNEERASYAEDAYACENFFRVYYHLQEQAKKQGDYDLLELFIYIMHEKDSGKLSASDWNLLTDVFDAVESLDNCEMLMKMMCDHKSERAYNTLLSFQEKRFSEPDDYASQIEVSFLEAMLETYQQHKEDPDQGAYGSGFLRLPFEWQVSFVANDLEVEQRSQRRRESSGGLKKKPLRKEQEIIKVITANKIAQGVKSYV